MDTLIDTLNELIEMSKDGQQASLDAAEHLISPDLQRILRQRADDCGHAAAALQALVQQEGAKPSAAD